MVPKKTNSERRRDPRLSKSIPIKICQDDGDIVTETANISRSGAYCRVNKPVAAMTKLKIHLLLPVKKGGKPSTRKITCDGVVVRVEDIPGESHKNIAVFFNDIKQRDAEAIADYVSSSLENDPTNVQ